MAGMVLTVEAEPIIAAPSLGDIRDAVARMTPAGGPGFLILEGRGDDYAQAAGGDGAFTAEWREYAGSRFRHWKAGQPGRPDTGEVAVLTNGYEVRVRSHERLGAADVVAILAAYLAGQGRPAEFEWRDMTATFQKGGESSWVPESPALMGDGSTKPLSPEFLDMTDLEEGNGIILIGAPPTPPSTEIGAGK